MRSEAEVQVVHASLPTCRSRSLWFQPESPILALAEALSLLVVPLSLPARCLGHHPQGTFLLLRSCHLRPGVSVSALWMRTGGRGAFGTQDSHQI